MRKHRKRSRPLNGSNLHNPTIYRVVPLNCVSGTLPEGRANVPYFTTGENLPDLGPQNVLFNCLLTRKELKTLRGKQRELYKSSSSSHSSSCERRRRVSGGSTSFKDFLAATTLRKTKDKAKLKHCKKSSSNLKRKLNTKIRLAKQYERAVKTSCKSTAVTKSILKASPMKDKKSPSKKALKYKQKLWHKNDSSIQDIIKGLEDFDFTLGRGYNSVEATIVETCDKYPNNEQSTHHPTIPNFYPTDESALYHPYEDAQAFKPAYPAPNSEYVETPGVECYETSPPSTTDYKSTTYMQEEYIETPVNLWEPKELIEDQANMQQIALPNLEESSLQQKAVKLHSAYRGEERIVSEKPQQSEEVIEPKEPIHNLDPPSEAFSVNLIKERKISERNPEIGGLLSFSETERFFPKQQTANIFSEKKQSIDSSLESPTRTLEDTKCRSLRSIVRRVRQNLSLRRKTRNQSMAEKQLQQLDLSTESSDEWEPMIRPKTLTPVDAERSDNWQPPLDTNYKTKTEQPQETSHVDMSGRGKNAEELDKKVDYESYRAQFFAIEEDENESEEVASNRPVAPVLDRVVDYKSYRDQFFDSDEDPPEQAPRTSIVEVAVPLNSQYSEYRDKFFDTEDETAKEIAGSVVVEVEESKTIADMSVQRYLEERGGLKLA